MEFTYRPTYVVVPQSGTARSGDRTIHWVDLHTGPITWQIRDQVGLRSATAYPAFAAALAKERKAELVTGDVEFKTLEKEVKIAWLK